MKRNWIFKVAASAIFCGVILFGAGWFETAVPESAADQERIARNLAILFKSARAVISDSQALINDESKGEKGLTGAKVKELAKEHYKKNTNKSFDALAGDTLEGKLMQALLDSIGPVMDKAQPLLNKEGVGFKGFIPAMFARQVAERFRQSAEGIADIKLTAPKNFLRNRSNSPDSWEEQVIESNFKAGHWEKGKAHVEVTDYKGKRAFRLMVPEYYGASCLTCHGDPKGERDITGGKKEGGKLDELGGAVSVAIYVK